MTKKVAALKIVELLRELVGKAQSGAIKFEWFKATSEELDDLFKTVLTKAQYTGFSLSSDMDLMWLDPDQYLNTKSYTYKWVTKVAQKRLDGIPEEDLPVIIYSTLKKLLGIKSFEKVNIVGSGSEKKLRKLDEGPSEAAHGEITYLELSKDTAVEFVMNLPATSTNSLSEDLVAITGERDTHQMDQDPLMRIVDIFKRSSVESKPKLSGEPPGDRHSVGNFRETILVKKINYRDKKGELHEFDYSHKPETLGNVLQTITKL